MTAYTVREFFGGTEPDDGGVAFERVNAAVEAFESDGVGGVRGEGSLEGWVWRIAFRVAIGSKGSRELAVEDVPEVAFVEASSDPTLAAAVRQLPPQRRLAVFLRYFADLSYAEIGEVLGIAEGTVAATLSQAHQQLGAALSANEVMA